MIGRVYGILKVEEAMEKKDNLSMYRCSCTCGGEIVVRRSNLVKGNAKTCGCRIVSPEIIGNSYGNLTVLEALGRNKHSQREYRCLCSCGKETIVLKSSLVNGLTKSCGCGMGNRVHGRLDKTKTKEEKATYYSWDSMADRCRNAKCRDYKNYGGRGIKVEVRWRKFENFLEDMGIMPLGYSIERVDVNKGYSKSNCIWLPKDKQAQNRRDTVWITVFGEKYCLTEACRLFGFSYRTIARRLKAGMTDEEAIADTEAMRVLHETGKLKFG
jgi:hypothetical protein